MKTRYLFPGLVLDCAKHVCRIAAGVQKYTRIVDDHIWCYLAGGTGEPILFLHGFYADKDRFGLFLPVFRRYRIISPDLPGFGESSFNSDAVYDIPSQSRRLGRFIESLGVSSVHVCGISMGGYLAAYFASEYPDAVKSLILMSAIGVDFPIKSDAMRMLLEKGRNIFLYSTPGEVEELSSMLFHRPPRIPMPFKRYFAELSLLEYRFRKKISEDILRSGLTLLEGRLSRITSPTLVIYGADDRMAHVSGSETFKREIPDCRVVVLDRCGHLPFVEQPARTKKACLDFLENVTRETGNAVIQAGGRAHWR